MQRLVPIGIAIIFLGFVLVMVGAMSRAKMEKTEVAVGGFIGFIPFGFATDKRLLWTVTILSALLFLSWIIWFLRVR